MLRKILSPITLPAWWQDALLAAPRLIIGYMLSTNFGASKFGLPWSPADNNLGLFEVAFWFPNDVAAFGGLFEKYPVFFAWMGAFSEAVGGVFLLLGLFTRPFSILILMTMFVAAFFQQADQGIWNMLPALGILWVALFYSVLGSGRFGLDYLLANTLKK